MDESSVFTCTQHPCDVQVENINIVNGEIEKIKIQNAVKAAYNIVCTGPQKQGQKTKITCTGSEPENTYWTAPKGPVSTTGYLSGSCEFLPVLLILCRNWPILVILDQLLLDSCRFWSALPVLVNSWPIIVMISFDQDLVASGQYWPILIF